MLDDLKYIHEKDAQDALGIAEKQWQQLEHKFDLPELSFPIDNIVFAGMGGSALAALLSLSWPDYMLPFEISRDYQIPSYVNEKTLFIASSYSGNTEETVEALETAASKNAHIAVISSGGRLQEIAHERGYPFAQLPGGYQPRHAVLYGLKALVTILERAKLLSTASAEQSLHEAAQFIRESTAEWRPDVKTVSNPAKQLALELAGKSPVIYAGPLLFPAAYKWKISFNENAKNVAWCNQFPEFNHNEFLGWTSHPIDKPYGVIELQSDLEHERVQKRFTVTNKLLSGRWPQPHIVEAKGETVLEQLLWMVALGDFVSLYVALLNGLNPTPVDLIEKFKTELTK
ncbi:bifunctional phosphoglucose/phosphomannose isomerase [Candidatus Saccharibacteria bacterium]|nr:bifunctional phosphoglucose/phosphomannose isomerase [Candidatus Saccharibacteria bacterium]